MPEAMLAAAQIVSETHNHAVWRRVLLVAALVWALVVVAPDFLRLHWNLASLGFSADNDGRIYEVDDDPASSAGLTTRDSIPLRTPEADGPPGAGACSRITSELCRDYLAVFGGMGGLAYVVEGTVVHLPVSGRGSPVTLVAAPQPLGGSAKFFLALDELAAVWVMWRSFRLAWTRLDAMTVGFFLYVMWFNPGQYFQFYAWLQPHPAWLFLQEGFQSLAQGAGYAGFLLFALRFPHNTSEPQFRWIEQLAIFLGVALAVLQLASFANVFGYRSETITECAILGGYAIAIAGFYIIWRRRKLQAPTDYQRMRWVLWGCAIGLPAFIFADSNEATSLWARYVWNATIWKGFRPGEAVYDAAFLISGVFAILICEAVNRPRIINVSIQLRRIAAWMGAVLLFYWLEHTLEQPMDIWLMQASIPSTVQWPAWAAVTCCAALASHKGADWAGDMITGRLRYAIEHLRKASAKAAHATRIEEVDRIVVDEAVKALNLSFAAVFRCINGTFREVYSLARSGMAVSCPPPNDNHLPDLRNGRIVRLASPRSPSLDTALLSPTIAVPAIAGPKLQAVVFYGPHETGEDIDALESDALKTFAQDAALGYETARTIALEEELHALRLQLAQRSR